MATRSSDLSPAATGRSDPPSEADEPADGEFVRSLARGLAVIGAFDAEHGAMSLSEVAARAGLTRATARRLLHTLVALGYVRHDGRAFTLTPQVLRLGSAYLSGMGLPDVAQPHLERLAGVVGESTSAAVLDGPDIVYVARVASTRRLMRVGITVGTRFPAFATSMGRVLLAGLPAAERAAALGPHLPALTPRTETDRDRLLAVLDRVAREGHALVDQELEAGLRSLAVPVRDRDGVVVAALNVSTGVGTDGDGEPDVLAHLPHLRATAHAVEADLALTRP